MMPAGLAAWERRDPVRSGIYLFERSDLVELDAAATRELEANGAAWIYFQAQPPGYRRLATLYVVSAKGPETRARRLAALIAHSAASRRLPQTLSAKKK